MDLEELTKTQIVLLTLLVSFVTSIATGIVTVSLMEQAPTDVTRVVQRVVERTVEKVTPAKTETKIITQEKKVIVRESDLVASAVKRVSPSIVRIYTDQENEKFVALGVVISAQGIIATDAQSLDPTLNYRVYTADDVYGARVSRSGGVRSIALLTLSDSETVPRPAGLRETNIPLGKTAVLLSGLKEDILSQGIVTQLDHGAFAAGIEPEKVLPGSIIVDTNGLVMGISTAFSRAKGENWFVPAHSILAVLNAPEESQDTQDTTSSTTPSVSTTTPTTTATTTTQEAPASDQQASAITAIDDTDTSTTTQTNSVSE